VVTQNDDTPLNEGADRLVEYARRQTRSAKRLPSVDLPADFPRDLFPGYTVVASVREGGQGAIYEAVEHMTKRRVAIKVLRSGPFSGEAEQVRFEREVQILGRLQHPHIVTIHTSGTTQRQRYFVMDFIEGKPLDEYVRDENLSVADTLALFLKIASAIDAAHVNGITHRDLKPANILVDPQGHPHVLDFGLAKTSDDAGVDVKVTTTGQFVGSLPWAAPEQLRDDPNDVDLRTDVYGLGIVLYFILTESLPYDRYGIARDVMNRILEGEHSPPSRYRKEIGNELDTIVLKCLRVSRKRRYQMAGEVARDIERYLAGEPIEAKRDSAGYLLMKTARRYRTAALFVALVVVGGVGYAVTVSILYGRAVESERVARQRTVIAQEQYRLARESLQFLVNDVLVQLDDIPGTSHAKRKLLRGAYDRLAPLATEHGDESSFRMDLIRTHRQLGNLAVQLFDDDEAKRHYESELRLRNELTEIEARSPENLSEFGINNVVLGDIARRRGELESCAFRYHLALDIDEQLVNDHPESTSFRDNLGWSYDRLGALAYQRNDVATAEVYFQKRLNVMASLVLEEPENPVRLRGLASSHSQLSQLAANRGELRTAVQHLENGISIVRQILSFAPANREAMSLQANSFCTLSRYRFKLDPSESSIGILEEAEALANALVKLEPELPRSHWGRAIVCSHRMEMAKRRGDVSHATEYALKSIESFEHFERLAPPSERSLFMRAAAHQLVARTESDEPDDETKQTHIKNALDIVKQAFDAKFDSKRLRVLRKDLVQMQDAQRRTGRNDQTN
jgi:eukaryotic-like serine/threonine-protein kinase